MRDIDIAKEYLLNNKVSLVLVKDGEVIFQDTEKGIKPLMKAIMEMGEKLCGASLADRVIGKAASMLCLKAGIVEIYSHIISESAVAILKNNNIKFEHSLKVPYILNRTKSGMCPIENIAKDLDEVGELIIKIKEFIKI